jgi:transposase
MGDGTEFDNTFLALSGFRALAVTDDGAELLVGIETIRQAAGCPVCGVIARTKDRLQVVIRGLPVINRRVRLVWSKRRFSCPDPDCAQRTWTESSDELPDRRVLSARAGRACTRAVGQEARSVASLARLLGVAWATVMSAVRDYGTPLVDDPDRVERVTALGIDETAFLKANAEHHTSYLTGLVDLERRVLIDMTEGNRAIDVSHWLSGKDAAFLSGIVTVACDLHEGYRSGLHPHLDHARQVADPFHVGAAANRCVDHVRRRVQDETFGHRGRKSDPLYRCRRLLTKADERLDDKGRRKLLGLLRAGDPHGEVATAWHADRSTCVTSISPTTRTRPPCSWTV